ncbi:hypothetical protein [Flavobacterium sp.]|uniref:hypothetical protein n=1 Tax=Flavobacterium sp. TaxID=239 RepID=UPI000EE96A89|nr:hypothetical protein [Flavobacterium sp.]HCQ12000.1 hypothetical protein [Flavobacterium sp.]
MINYKIAEKSDWEMLSVFYKKAYREHHPLQNQEFWNWQYGNENFGRAIIGVYEDEIIAHLGVMLFEDYIFSLNLFVDSRHRNGDEFFKLVEIANQFRRQHIGVAVNQNAFPLFRMMKWYHYVNLERRLKVHPDFPDNNIQKLLEPVPFFSNFDKPIGHFWEQPNLKSIKLDDGSTAIIQNEVGGIRFVEIKNVKKATQQVFEMGFKWCDFVTSFNNPILMKLEMNNWKTENELEIPWLLNPLEYGSKSNLSFLSKNALDINFYINRMHSDLGRIGSIK